MRKMFILLSLLPVGLTCLTYLITLQYRRNIFARDLIHHAISPSKLHGNTEQYFKNLQLAHTSLDKEYSIDQLNIQGTLPSWLIGDFYYNGPAIFTLNNKTFDHTFDGFAMIHKFNIQPKNVRYINKLLDTKFRQQAIQKGRLSLGFVEEGGSSWKIVTAISSLMSKPKKYDNANINVLMLGDHMLACTETPHMIAFDPQTLKTIGPFSVDQKQQCHVATPHPLYDENKKVWYNIFTQFGHKSNYYIYQINPQTAQSTTLASIPVDYPGYMHSFAMTQNYIILIESPLIVNPYDFLTSSKPFIENFIWKPQQKTRFIIVDKNTGKQKKILLAQNAFYLFHQINAFEQNDEIILDLITYSDVGIIQNSSKIQQLCCSRSEKDKGFIHRFNVNIKKNVIEEKKLSHQDIEFPIINQEHASKSYNFIYGISADDMQLLKIDLEANKILYWQQQGCLVGQPIFVSHPKATHEDDGAILLVVLDTIKKHSFLLILNAKNMKELARVQLPHHIPLGFHGIFIKNNNHNRN